MQPITVARLCVICLGALASDGIKPGPAEAALTLSPVVQGLAQPVYVTHAGDGSNRLLIVEQAGRIKVLHLGSTIPTVFLDISAVVRSPATGGGEEQGLFSVAFPPNYASTGVFYVYYTREPDGAIVIGRYRVSGNPDVANPTETPLLIIPHPTFPNHNGGQLQFGPDGCLYAGTGDGGGAGDPNRNAQNLGSLLGKLLRLDETGAPCTNLSANPFLAVPGAARIWALGLRNPWRFSFDRQTGDLYIADVGQNTREEVDVQPSGSGGLNYCWSTLEGTLPFNADVSCTLGTPTPPILEYGHMMGRCAITGGYAYRGGAASLAPGAYVFGDFCSGEIFLSQGGFQSLLLTTNLAIASFGEDEAGEIYVVDRNGSIYCLMSTGGPELTLGLDRLLAYGTGDTLRVGLGARNSGPAFAADVYLGVLMPDQVTVLFITGTSPLTGQVILLSADPRSFPPLATEVSVASSLSVPLGQILALTLPGTAPPGSYRLLVVLAVPGAFGDGRIDAGDVIAVDLQSFVFTP